MMVELTYVIIRMGMLIVEQIRSVEYDEAFQILCNKDVSFNNLRDRIIQMNVMM